MRLAASVTTIVTVVTPTLNVFVPICPFPLNIVAPVLLHEMLDPGQLSPKVIVGTATSAEHKSVVLLTVIFEGQVMVGFSVSFTVTVKLHCSVFGGEAPSDTVTVTVVKPLLKTTPFRVAGMVPVVAPVKT